MADFMNQFAVGSWWHYGLFTSFMAAGFLLANQHYKLNAGTLMLWRGFGVALAFLPFMLLSQQPTDPTFYYAVIAQGLIVSIVDRITITSASRFGAGITSRLLPIGVWVTFVIWLVMKPAYFYSLTHDMTKLAAVTGAIVVAVVAMFFMRRDTVSKEALMFLLPNIFLFGVIDVLNKTAIDASGDPVTGAYAYGFWLSLIVGVCTLLSRRILGQKKLNLHEAFEPRTIKCGLMMVAFMLLAMFSKNLGMFKAANPAYIGLLTLSTPIWIAFYNRFTGHKDKSNLWAGMLFVLSAAVLIAFTK